MRDNTGQSILFCAIYIHETSNFRLLKRLRVRFPANIQDYILD